MENVTENLSEWATFGAGHYSVKPITSFCDSLINFERTLNVSSPGYSGKFLIDTFTIKSSPISSPRNASNSSTILLYFSINSLLVS